MKIRHVHLVIAFLLLSAAGTAHAGTLTSATFGQNSFVSTATGGLIATGTSTGSSAVNVRLTIPATTRTLILAGTPSVAFVTSIGGSQTLAWTAGGSATVDQGILGGVHADIVGLPHTFGHAFLIPVSAGASIARTPIGSSTSVTHIGWRTGTITRVLTLSGSPNGTFRLTGSNALTPMGGGTLTLVSATVIDFSCPPVICSSRTNAQATTLTLNFVPEPSRLILLSATLVGATIAGSRKSRS